jgi:hypothetical protein
MLRCTAQPTDIDGRAGPRTNDLLSGLLGVEMMTDQKIWDEYGFDTSVIVSTTNRSSQCTNADHISSLLLVISLVLRYTKCFHQTSPIRSLKERSRIIC